jgi:hypothetical protein
MLTLLIITYIGTTLNTTMLIFNFFTIERLKKELEIANKKLK